MLKRKERSEREKIKNEHKVEEVDNDGNPVDSAKAAALQFYDGPAWVSEARIDKTEYTGGPSYLPSAEESRADKKSDESYSEESDEEFNWYD